MVRERQQRAQAHHQRRAERRRHKQRRRQEYQQRAEQRTPRAQAFAEVLASIRANDALMRQFGCDLVQRGYVHAGARVDMLKRCPSENERQLIMDAFAAAEAEGTVPSTETVWRFVQANPSHASPMIDQERLAEASERLTRGGVHHG